MSYRYVFRLITSAFLILLLIFLPWRSVLAHGVLDQVNDGSFQDFACPLSQNIRIFAPDGQEFTPSLPVLVGVDVHLYDYELREGSAFLTLNIRPYSLSEAPIVSQNFEVAAHFFGFVHVDLPPTNVTPGQEYVIELITPSDWDWGWSSTGGPTSTYEGGNQILYGEPQSDNDFCFRTYGQEESGPLGVQIDIKPGSDPNSINPKNNGVIPVALLTAGSFDASSVDPSTVLFGGASPKNYSFADVDQDGDQDFVAHFKTREVSIDESGTQICLSAQTTQGQNLEGCDSIRLVPYD